MTVHPQTIPIEWLTEAGLIRFAPTRPSYCCDEPRTRISINTIAPFFRDAGVTLDQNGFRRDGMMKILHGIAREEAIPPILVAFDPLARVYRLRDGFHRYYAKFWLNFPNIPVDIVPSY